MGGEDVAIAAAGGMADPPGAIGTDAMVVMEAIERVSSDDGVLVLMDLGSAVMSAEMAVEMAGDGVRTELAGDAPLVEGAVAAAAAARGGLSLDEVAAAARGAVAAPAGGGAGGAPPAPGGGGAARGGVGRADPAGAGPR